MKKKRTRPLQNYTGKQGQNCILKNSVKSKCNIEVEPKEKEKEEQARRHIQHGARNNKHTPRGETLRRKTKTS